MFRKNEIPDRSTVILVRMRLNLQVPRLTLPQNYHQVIQMKHRHLLDTVSLPLYRPFSSYNPRSHSASTKGRGNDCNKITVFGGYI